MASPESILAQAAADGSFSSDDADAWPRTLKYILDRLDEIYRDFPKPPNRPTPPPDAPSESPPLPERTASQESQATDKENAPPAPRPTVPTFLGTPPSSQSSHEPSYPPETLSFYTAIRASLQKNFAKEPPHTVQRLAELILEPKKHYKFLPSYLRALDRVVSVTSTTTIFPFPASVLPNGPGFLNGTAATPPSTLGSDESLGGALLTPIPWLQNRGSQSELISESSEMVDGPNGAGRIETVSVVNGQLTSVPSQPQAQIESPHPDGEPLPSTGPVTQGELLRQEQEAGVTLSNPHSIQPGRSLLGEIEGGGVVMQTVEGEEEAPHARGPEVIGMEDTGLQRSSRIDIEGAVGRPALHRESKSPNPPARSEEEKETEGKDEEMKDQEDGEKGKEEVMKKDEEMTT